jgi:DNA invertase Pin-like site-specific DNA recombinase
VAELLGYARVSTTEQNADLQRDALTGPGVASTQVVYGVAGDQRRGVGM